MLYHFTSTNYRANNWFAIAINHQNFWEKQIAVILIVFFSLNMHIAYIYENTLLAFFYSHTRYDWIHFLKPKFSILILFCFVGMFVIARNASSCMKNCICKLDWYYGNRPIELKRSWHRSETVIFFGSFCHFSSLSFIELQEIPW